MRSKDELIKALGALHGTPNAATWEEAKAEFTVSCLNDIVNSMSELNKTIQDNSKSNDAIANKVFWLNIVIAAATVVGSIATAVIAFSG